MGKGSKRKRFSRAKRKRLQKEWKVVEVEENMDAGVSFNLVQLDFFTIHLSPKCRMVCERLHYIRM